MASKPQAYSGKQVPFSSENEVCRQAHFIKSPPPQLFSSQASWKSRYFILSKTEKNCYSLQYFKDHQYRGAIGVDEISSIEVGISNQEKMALVQKMFKCLPGEVMSIITPKRDYFLISKDWRTIDDWVSFISSSCLDLKDTHQNVKNPNLVNQDARNEANVVRPFDSGGNQNIYEIIPEVHDEVWEIDFSEDKRPASHPDHSSGSSTSLKDKTYSSLPRNGLPDVKTAALTRSHAVKLKTLLKQHQTEGNSSRPGQSPLMSDLAPENQQETEDENHYLSPRNVLAQLDNVIASNEDKEFAESKEPDQVSKPTDHLYMSMKSRFDEEKFQQPSNSEDEAQAFPENQAEGLNLQGQEDRSKLCHSSSSKGPKTKNQKKELVSLSVVQLSRIINNIPAGSPLEKVDVFLSKKDINKYLTFTQAMGHICVTQWEGAPHLGCIFHHGDRLSAVNDLKPHTLEEAGLFLDRSLGKEVKLTICRIPGSDKFHTRACACS
ncbi:pleckstrin homology domain-containing family S member 1 isoform X2 [Trichosurus vulpecula]|uniref:pleckstrin homology domain-containing family S member 1 isoform X2 n=1 Tax=Trichosurus vulpecula TaxID=9337 RepID=UPI00186AD01C|nr:pleckstrin homology domain-containing family S member 1 isoform X2 [Trichosurus vulpecula]